MRLRVSNGGSDIKEGAGPRDSGMVLRSTGVLV
jgi:hypothetical protein